MFRSTGGLASILKDSGEVKFSKEEQSLTCCILCTADYCLETTQQVRGRGLVPKYVALLHFPSLPRGIVFSPWTRREYDSPKNFCVGC